MRTVETYICQADLSVSGDRWIDRDVTRCWLADSRSDAIERAGATPGFLPPDSPDFNPIDNAFSKLKALLRARAERTISALWDAVGSLLDPFTPCEWANGF